MFPSSNLWTDHRAAALTKPKEATRIIDELKKIPVESQSAAAAQQIGRARTKGVCLDCPEVEADGKAKPASHGMEPSEVPTSTSHNTEAPTSAEQEASRAMRMQDHLAQLTSYGVPSAGKAIAQLATTAGAFEALAGATGRMIDSSGAHTGIVKPPTDRMSVLVYW